MSQNIKKNDIYIKILLTILFERSARIGNYIVIQHNSRYSKLYQHLSQTFKVSVGQKVSAGQVVAISGHSGIGSGAHLHLEVWDTEMKKNPRKCSPKDNPNLCLNVYGNGKIDPYDFDYKKLNQ